MSTDRYENCPRVARLREIRESVIADVVAERIRQHEKFGDQSGLGRMFMLAVLMEEVGEVAREVHEAEQNRLAWEAPVEVRSHFLARIRAELVQVAAVAVQMIEHIDREAGA